VAVETWLVDKSALIRLNQSPDSALWAERVWRGLVRISSITMMELAYSFRSHAEATAAVQEIPLRAIPVEYLGQKAESRAQHIQWELLGESQHRGVSVPDLLIAASAEVGGHTVLHVDSDFELIARYSGQRTEKLVLS
jgi:hypothetical protein